MSLRRLKVTVGEPASPSPNIDGDDTIKAKRQTVGLGNGSEVVFIPRLISFDQAWKWFDYLDTQIAWTRPTIRVFGRSCLQVSLSRSLSLSCVLRINMPSFVYQLCYLGIVDCSILVAR